MNERNNTSKVRAFVNSAFKKFSGLNKGSKILLNIGAFVFLGFLLAALALTVLFATGLNIIDGNVRVIQWIVIYSFRFWIMLVFGALILDILINR